MFKFFCKIVKKRDSLKTRAMKCITPLVPKKMEKVRKKVLVRYVCVLWTDVRLRTPGRKNRVAKCTL